MPLVTERANPSPSKVECYFNSRHRVVHPEEPNQGRKSPPNQPILGYRTGGELLRRVEQALDPESRFGRL